MPATVKKWSESVADDFKFTFKLWQGITHQKEFSFDRELLRKFIHTIDQVGDKKGSLLVQLPPGTGVKHVPQLLRLMHTIREENPSCSWDLALEFRNPSWYVETTYNLMQAFDAGLVLHDKPGAATPMIHHRTDFIYLRFHGPKGDYKGGYDDNFLTEYAGYIHEWKREGKRVYVYFNNTAGDAIRNLQTLNNELDRLFMYDIHNLKLKVHIKY